MEALERLKAGEVMVGLAQAGPASASDAESLVSLASLFYEPLWVFHRKGAARECWRYSCCATTT